MSVIDLVREELREFAGYSSARREASGGELLLNANESPWPVPGDALGLNRYPEPQPAALIDRLAALYGVETDRILVGRGSDEAIDLLVRALCRAGRDSVLIAPPTFGMYAVCARIQGAGLRSVPLRVDRDFMLDVDAVLDAADESVRLVFACSPNNPTGRQLPLESLERLAQALAGRALLVVDEAYAEFASGPGAVALLPRYPGLAVLRTLSKAYGLAGARVGALLADPQLLGVLRSIMAPYPLPTPSVNAALEALQPNAVALARSRVALLCEERGRLAAALAGLPDVQHVYGSDANFLLVRFADSQATLRRTRAAGIVLRDPGRQIGLEGCLRISVGTPEQNDRLLRLLASPSAVSAVESGGTVGARP